MLGGDELMEFNEYNKIHELLTNYFEVSVLQNNLLDIDFTSCRMRKMNII